MNNLLRISNNFAKTEKNKSKLLYGVIEDNPDFSLVIPVYGCNKYLQELIKNILEQEKTNIKIEIIISDNKEYDKQEKNDVLELLKQYNKLNITYYLSEKELGQLNNFNRAISLANSNYVAMVHDDDLLIKNYFSTVEKVLKFMHKNKNAAMLHACYKIFYDKVELDCEKNTSIREITKSMVSFIGVTQTGIPSCGTIFNKSIFQKCGGFNDLYPSSGDAFLAAIMLNERYRIYQFTSLTGYYRVAVNNSVKLDVCQGFIKEDETFRDCWQKRPGISSLILRISRRFLYSKNIDTKVELFGDLNDKININNLDYKGKYKKYSQIGFINIFRKTIALFYKLTNKFRIKKLR